MSTLTGKQRKYLRGLAHNLKPVILIGMKGVTDTVIESIDEQLAIHELIKIKFNDYKDEKKEISAEIVDKTGAELAGIIGHTAIFYREHKDPEKRKITFDALAEEDGE